MTAQKAQDKLQNADRLACGLWLSPTLVAGMEALMLESASAGAIEACGRSLYHILAGLCCCSWKLTNMRMPPLEHEYMYKQMSAF